MIIEHSQEGKPHEGKILAAIQPHSDDIPIFAGGTVAKLIDEGYTGYLIRTSNDDHAGVGGTVGEVIKTMKKIMKHWQKFWELQRLLTWDIAITAWITLA